MQNINEEFLGEGVYDIQNAACAISLTKKLLRRSMPKLSKGWLQYYL
jgi:hypothetical protein